MRFFAGICKDEVLQGWVETEVTLDVMVGCKQNLWDKWGWV